MLQKCSILTLAPYKILPATTGGHLSITLLHHYIGKVCQVHLAGTADNEDRKQYAFQLHPVFPPAPVRYLPLYGFSKLSGLAKRYDATAIICEHPYMALTAIALSRKLKIPWYLRSQNIESERFKSLGKKWWPILKSYEQFAMRKADGVFFIAAEEAQWAIEHFGLSPQKCHHIPYGTDLSAPPPPMPDAKSSMAEQYSIDPTVPWVYFLGAMNYQPNEDAVKIIVNELLPELKRQGKHFQFIIAGKGLSAALQQQIAALPNIRYLGFVDNLEQMISACDVMVNPVLTGGGIKTKAVEALAYSKMVVSTASGAQGIVPAACGGNLTITPDDDWKQFARAVISIADKKETIPQAFYDTYYWGNIANTVINIVNCRK